MTKTNTALENLRVGETKTGKAVHLYHGNISTKALCCQKLLIKMPDWSLKDFDVDRWKCQRCARVLHDIRCRYPKLLTATPTWTILEFQVAQGAKSRIKGH